MKKCPTCNQTYTDDNLSFCLSDGSILQQMSQQPDRGDPPPTVVMDYPRPTNEYVTPNQPQTPPYAPMGTWQGGSPPMMPPPAYVSQNQTLPTISLVLGIFGLLLICCYGGIPLGLAAIITGYIGMNNANNDPIQYGGKGLAVAGMIIGGTIFILNILFIFLGIIGNLLGNR